MTAQTNLHLVAERDDDRQFEGEPAQAAPAPSPKLFTRLIATPLGAPWDQARAANLEARLGAPLPLAEVVFRLRRLDHWRPGAPGRYAVVYVRSREVGAGLVTTATVDGREIAVSFLSGDEQARRLRRVLTAGLSVAATVLVAAASVSLAFNRRAEAEARLRTLEQVSDVRLKGAETHRRLRAQAVALDAAGVRDQRLNDMLDDLAWASQSKSPNARIRAFHWDHGYMALEVQGETPPFERPSRVVEKAPKPIRGDVWLWGVEPEAGLRRSGSGR